MRAVRSCFFSVRGSQREMRLTAKEAQRIDQQTESFWRQQAEEKIMVRKKQEKVWAKTRVFGSDALGNRIPLTHNHRGVKIGPNLVTNGPCEKCGCLRSHAQRCKYFEDSFAYCVQRRYRERNASSESSARSSESASGSSVVGEHRPSGAPEENSEPA